MVDSLVFRIKNIKEKEALVAYLFRRGQSGATVYDRELNTDYDPRKQLRWTRYYMDELTGRSSARGHNNHLKSYVYDIAYFINFNRDYIEFNFSLPKYLFGNNLLQSVPHLYDNFYGEYKTKKFSQLNKLHWNFLRKALNYFFSTEFINLMPPKKDVELISIDLCFNLFFKRKSDLEYYLSFLRTVKKKNFHEGSDHAANWNSSMHYKGTFHTLKIYDKGKEFKRHDYRKISKRFGQDSANKIQEIADNVLRMEVSFKKRGLTHYYYSKLCPSPYFRAAYKSYRSRESNGSFIYEGVRYEVGQVITDKNEAKKIKELLRVGKKLNNRQIGFYFDLDDSTNQERFDFESIFTESMFYHLCHRYYDIVKQFRLDSWKEFENHMSLLGKKNIDLIQRGKSKNLYSEVELRKINELLKTNSWSQIREKKLVSRTNYFKYKKFFEESGMGEISTDVRYSSIDYTFGTYYFTVIPHLQKLSKRIRLPFQL